MQGDARVASRAKRFGDSIRPPRAAGVHATTLTFLIPIASPHEPSVVTCIPR